MELSTSQYYLLKRLCHADLDLSLCSSDEAEDISFLADMGLIQYNQIYDEKNPRIVLQHFAHIRPKGKAEYDAYIRTRNRWFIPLFVSIAALLISFAALATDIWPLLSWL